MRQKHSTHFEVIGYHVDYYVGVKYIGSLPVETPDRDVMGYRGRQVGVTTEDITFTNKKKLKAGSQVMTECIPLCGKMLNPVHK